MIKKIRSPNKRKVQVVPLKELAVITSPCETAKWSRKVTMTCSIPKTDFAIHYSSANGRDVEVQIGGKCPAGWQTSGKLSCGDEAALTMTGMLIF